MTVTIGVTKCAHIDFVEYSLFVPQVVPVFYRLLDFLSHNIISTKPVPPSHLVQSVVDNFIFSGSTTLS